MLVFKKNITVNRKIFKITFLFFSLIVISCNLDVSNNFKEINPKNLKYTSKKLVEKINCGSLFELYIDEGAFGGHEDYVFEHINGKVYYLSDAFLHNTSQGSVFNPVDSSIVYFDKDAKQIWPPRILECRFFWIKKSDGNIITIDSMKVNTSEYVEKMYKLNEKNQLEPYLDLKGNEFSWSFEDGIYFVGYPGVFYKKKLNLCSLE